MAALLGSGHDPLRVPEAAVRRLQREQSLGEGDEPVPGVGVGQCSGGDLVEGRQPLGQEGVEQRRRAREVGVQRADADLRPARDVLHGRVEATFAETGSDAVREAMGVVYPAIDVAGPVLPGMVERGRGGLLFAGGLSAVRPMPALGPLAVAAGTLRTYELTLHTLDPDEVADTAWDLYMMRDRPRGDIFSVLG